MLINVDPLLDVPVVLLRLRLDVIVVGFDGRGAWFLLALLGCLRVADGPVVGCLLVALSGLGLRGVDLSVLDRGMLAA